MNKSKLIKLIQEQIVNVDLMTFMKKISKTRIENLVWSGGIRIEAIHGRIFIYRYDRDKLLEIWIENQNVKMNWLSKVDPLEKKKTEEYLRKLFDKIHYNIKPGDKPYMFGSGMSAMADSNGKYHKVPGYKPRRRF